MYYSRFFERDQPTSYTIASAILRIASKYMIESLRQEAIEHFRRIVPQSLREIGGEEPYSQVFGSDKAEWPHPFQLLSLFRECQLRPFLPWAYYSVCTFGFEELIQGVVTHNGMDIRLDAHDTRIVLLGWNSLCTATRITLNKTIRSSAKGCQADSNCNEALRLNWMLDVANSVDSRALHQWGRLGHLSRGKSHDTAYRDPPCKLCIEKWFKEEENARVVIWRQLPSMFELPDWKLLKRDHEESSGDGVQSTLEKLAK